MGNRIIWIGIACLGSLTGNAGAAELAGRPAGLPDRLDPGPVSARATAWDVGDWITEEADNVCGLKDPRQIRTPAAVDFESLILSTPEGRELKRRGIDKDSPEGQVLYNKAVDKVRTAAGEVMRNKGYDSIWKQIRHKRGQKAPDVTDEVRTLVEKNAGR